MNQYRPFSNGSEAADWRHGNCDQCKFHEAEEAPVCPGDEALTLAAISDGTISEEACDFIGTRSRDDGWCSLNKVCRHWSHPDSPYELPDVALDTYSLSTHTITPAEQQQQQQHEPAQATAKDTMETIIIGRIVEYLPVGSGMGANGPWMKQEFLIETEGPRPKKALITDFNDKAGAKSFGIGTLVKIVLDISARKSGDRWYNSINVWSMVRYGDQSAPAHPPVATQPTPPAQTLPPHPPQATAPRKPDQLAFEFNGPDDDTLPF
jgi:hypothetical protein